MDILEAMKEGIKANGACKAFKGGTLEQLAEQLFTPQGVEFVMKTGYPRLYEFREIQKQTDLKKFGIYVDAGEISLTEKRRAFLVGNTVAKMTYRELDRNNVYLLHGAKADIKASGYAVIKVEHDSGSSVESEATEKAVILW